MTDQQNLPPNASQTQSSSTNKNVLKVIGCSCLALLLVGGLGFGGCVWVGMKAIKKNEPYLKAVETVVITEEVKTVLGEPVTVGFFPMGNIGTKGGSIEANWSIPVSGPKAKGSIEVAAKKSGGVWTYETFEVIVDGTGEKIPMKVP